MDLKLSSEDLAFQNDVRAWVESTMAKSDMGLNKNLFNQTRDETKWWQEQLNSKGWGAVGWPAEYGGTDWTESQRVIFAAECSRGGAPMQSPFGTTMVGPVIYTFGTDALKAQHLPSILDGSQMWCQGYSEPGSGSDLASLRTSAIRDGDDYIVNGQKIWTTQAHWADWIFCLGRTSTEGKPQQGISFLLIDMKSPGVEVKAIHTIDGEHHLNEVYFSDVRVPATNLVGEENQGWTYAKFLLTNERTGIANTDGLRAALGNVKAMNSFLKETAAESYASSDVERQHAELSVRVDALSMLEARALTAGEGSGESMILPLPLKLLGTHLQQDISDLAVSVLEHSTIPKNHYGFGVSGTSNAPSLREQGPNVMSGMLSGRASTIYGGTSEVQRGIMAKFVLGL